MELHTGCLRKKRPSLSKAGQRPSHGICALGNALLTPFPPLTCPWSESRPGQAGNLYQQSQGSNSSRPPCPSWCHGSATPSSFTPTHRHSRMCTLFPAITLPFKLVRNLSCSSGSRLTSTLFIPLLGSLELSQLGWELSSCLLIIGTCTRWSLFYSQGLVGGLEAAACRRAATQILLFVGSERCVGGRYRNPISH